MLVVNCGVFKMERLAQKLWANADTRSKGAVDWIVLTTGATFLAVGILASFIGASADFARDTAIETDTSFTQPIWQKATQYSSVSFAG
jgi:hypothetical protein